MLQGPTELLPVSTSGHTTLVPGLLGWPYGELDPELRKAFEVALHAGTAAALLIGLRDEVGDAARGFGRRAAPRSSPARSRRRAIAGWRLERPIERRLGTPASVALGLIAGSVAMAAADRAPQHRAPRATRRSPTRSRSALAQACALVPGVSRNGATLTAARLRGFRRADANVLSRHIALPVIVGATRSRARAWPAAACRRELRRGIRRRRGRLVRLDARLGAADRAARARAARCVPYAGLPRAPLGGGSSSVRALRPSNRRAMSDAYAAAGVDTAQPGRAVDALVAVLRDDRHRAPVALGRRLGPLRERARRSTSLGLALCTDGVGTKLIVAEQAGRFDTVGIDCVAMNVNDLICVGAEPIAMVDYLAVEQADADGAARRSARA